MLRSVYRTSAGITIRWRRCIRSACWTRCTSLLRDNRMRPFFLFDAVPTRVVEASELADVDPTLESLRNLNTPEEYQRACADVENANG